MTNLFKMLKEYQVAIIGFSLVVASILSFFLLAAFQKDNTYAQTGTLCAASYAVTVANGGTTSGVVTGLVNVGLSSSQTSGEEFIKINRVQFTIDSKILGRGNLNGTSQYFWSTKWLSSVTNNGQYEVGAKVWHNNGYFCETARVPVFVQNQVKTPIPVEKLNPGNWSGPTNYPTDFEISPLLNGLPDLRGSMETEWSTNIGTINKSNPNYIGRFSSGPSGGDGRVRARIFYGGEVRELEAPVKVTSFSSITNDTYDKPDDSSTGSSESESDDSGSSDSDGTEIKTNADGSIVESDKSTLTSQLLSSDGSIRQCLLNSIGEDRLKAIEAEKSRPTSVEFEKYRNCFAKRSFVVAQSLAPVAPDKVREIAKSENLRIENAETQTVEIEGNIVNTIVFRGTARPNSTVLIYIFSEPIVLTTAANESGEWTYTLEDPLEPGDHEAYTVVDTGNGEYERSDVFSFAVARAEATDSNPNGFSLQLATTATATANDRSRNIFIASAVGIILVTVITMMVMLNLRHKKNSQNQLQSSEENNDSQTPFMQL